MIRLIPLLALALAACATTPPAGRSLGPHGHHEAPLPSEVAAATSLREQAMIGAELTYTLGSYAYAPHHQASSAYLEERLYDGLLYLREIESGPEDQLVATLFYFNFAAKDLADYVEAQEDPDVEPGAEAQPIPHAEH